jgi:hypothetical protein
LGALRIFSELKRVSHTTFLPLFAIAFNLMFFSIGSMLTLSKVGIQIYQLHERISSVALIIPSCKSKCLFVRVVNLHQLIKNLSNCGEICNDLDLALLLMHDLGMLLRAEGIINSDSILCLLGLQISLNLQLGI